MLAGGEAVRAGVFNTVSMMTTTGFANADFTLWTSLTSVVLFGVTLLGASAGSTSGSIKLIRHVVIAKMLRREIDQTLHPGVVVPLRVNGAVVDERALRAIIVFVFLYLGVWAAGVDRDPARLDAAERGPDRVPGAGRLRLDAGRRRSWPRLRGADGLLRAVQQRLNRRPHGR